MINTKKILSVSCLSAIFYALMILVNALANIIPINGVNTGQVSDNYGNLFAPAPVTFSIWGLIYLLLGLFVIYQLGYWQKKSILGKDVLDRVGILFIISSAANLVWIFSWHYDAMFLSLILMAVILVCLILINNTLKNKQLSFNEKIFLKLPFSIYFGWITIATIANITTFLVGTGIDAFSRTSVFITIVVLFVGLLIGAVTMIANRDYAYGAVIFWAYSGIIIKHISESGFDGKYYPVIIAATVCLTLLVIAAIYIPFSRKKKMTF